MTGRGSVRGRLRRQVIDRADGACEYCQTPQELSPSTLEVDHIVARASGGRTEFDNLCLACSNCNGAKQDRTEVRDARSRRMVPLFHPREHRWDEHFQWSDDFTVIAGTTSIGRATVDALNMNAPRMVLLRRLWVMMQVFPHDH